MLQNKENAAPQSTHPKYRPDIDGLRAVAVLAVVVFHAFPEWLPGGFIGVDIFFVISGFLIGSILFKSLSQERFSFIDFYSRRIRRIFPALFVVMVTSLIIGWYVLFADEYKQLGKHIAAGTGFVANFAFWTESGYFDTAAELKPMLHLWSLAIEEQFYLIWPLVLWVAWKIRSNLLAVTVAIALVSFSINIWMVQSHPAATFFLLPSRAWELLVGSILAWLSLQPFWLSQQTRLRDLLENLSCTIGIVLIFWAMLFITPQSAFPGWYALAPALGAALFIAAGPSAWINRYILANKAMVWVGLISFPLYLWHWPLLSFARIVESEVPSETIRLTAATLSVLLAWLTYRFIETPIRHRSGFITKATAMLCAVALLGCAGYAIFKQDGLEFRAAANAAEINKFDLPYRHSCEPLMGSAFRDDWCNAENLKHTSPDVVMIGDSFSNAYSDTLNEFAKITGSITPVQLGRGRCPSLIGYGPDYCVEVTSATSDYIAKTQSVHTVVLAANWPMYVSGQGYSWPGGNPPIFSSKRQ